MGSTSRLPCSFTPVWTSHAIENMLNIPPKQLDAIYEKILKLGLAEVVIIRREIQLTTKGVRYISDATKAQTN
jgi:helix-turn-helix protein